MIRAWLRRWRERRQERRINRAWLREAAEDQEILEGCFDYGDIGGRITVMTPKTGSSEERGQ